MFNNGACASCVTDARFCDTIFSNSLCAHIMNKR